ATDFTSLGPASDGDVKPNVSALGKQTFMQKSSGLLGYRDGTSFSSPLLAGMAACLWQAHPQATAAQVKSAMEQSGHLFDKPDPLLGFGIPDMHRANILLMNLKTQPIDFHKKWMVYPNPVTDNLILQNTGTVEMEKVTLSFFSLDGRLLHVERQTGASKMVLNNLHSLPAGLFILKIDTENSSESFKISKAF
ncbi:MAG: T9SS type A sorting domain-containing protein, partial [Bacteroidia bacterium]|nr:T9SS type A sorting domain-containing protein [Bacteroidia bacterium]